MTRVGGEEEREKERDRSREREKEKERTKVPRDGEKMRENKIYPGHWRDFVSYILFEPIGFIYAGGRGLEHARGCTRRNSARVVGKGVSLFAHLATPPRPFAVRTPYFIVYLIPRCLSPVPRAFSYFVQV